MNSNGAVDIPGNAQIESSNPSLSVSPAPEARHRLAQPVRTGTAEGTPNPSAVGAALPITPSMESPNALADGNERGAASGEFVPEPERYELRSTALHQFNLQRRDFFKLMGAGIAIFTVARNSASAQESGAGRRRPDQDQPKDISSWLHINDDGIVTVFTGKVEVGQNTRTTLAQSVADELRVPLASIRMVMGDTALTPFDMGTFGSRSTPYMSPVLRRAASAARDLLLAQAAAEWNSTPDKLKASDGKITNSASGAVLTYAQLAQGKTLAHDMPDADPITPPTGWTVAGTSTSKIDARGFVTGQHQYTPDIRPANLLHAKVLRPESFGATLVSTDLSAAQAMPGVVAVRDGDFIAVAAPSEGAAERAIAAIHAEWKSKPQSSSKELFSYLKQNLDSEDRPKANEKGSVANGLAAAAQRFEQRAAESHDVCADDLMAQSIGIDDGAAFERGDDANHANLFARLIDGDFGEGCQVAAFFKPAAHAEALSWLGFLLRPSEAFCGGFEDSTQARIGKILHAEFERIDFRGVSEFVHEGFAREVIGGCRESAIGALTQRRIHGMKLNQLMGDVVGSLDAGAA